MANNFTSRTAQALSEITKDKNNLQYTVTNELKRLEGIQNKIITSTGDIAKVYGNNALSNIRTEQNNILTKSTADLYASQNARDNLSFQIQQTQGDLASAYSQNVTQGLSDVGNIMKKTIASVNNLEEKKRSLALAEAKGWLQVEQAQNDARFGWDQFDLASGQLELAKLKLEHLISLDQRQENYERS